MRGQNNRAIGSTQEARAREFLEQKGMKILEQNFRCRSGEIDLIGCQGGYLVFVEVKYRKTKRAGHPAEAVTLAKQRKICQTADYYRYCRQLGEDVSVRYDVVAMTEEEIFWYPDAFSHQY